jgi:carboxyl-terminal processing protease
MTSDAVAKALKGPKGTHVQVTMAREGQAKPLVFDLVRDEIPHPSVDLKYEIKPGIGYVHLTQFQETTAQEVLDAVDSFGNLKGLVFDLRGNPGGLLSQAVEVCDHLLSKGQGIVSQRGRAYPDQNYVATHGNDGKAFPIVVLVNRNTASAAEIVSGALQDHDRALILGETTFGKGLVQTVYPLSDNTALALTWAHFYTPSGRLIQRDYSNKSFYDYYTHRDENARNPVDVKMTEGGRTVYGGGGITPDEKYTEPVLDSLEVELMRKSAFFNYTRSYFGTHDTSLPKNWMPDDASLIDFHDYLLKQKYTFTEGEFTQDRDWIKRQLAGEMYITAFNKDESDRVLAQTDPEVERAVESMPRARALVETAKKVVAQRMSAQPPTAQSLAQH